jgi:hypothetical protein
MRLFVTLCKAHFCNYLQELKEFDCTMKLGKFVLNRIDLKTKQFFHNFYSSFERQV